MILDTQPLFEFMPAIIITDLEEPDLVTVMGWSSDSGAGVGLSLGSDSG